MIKEINCLDLFSGIGGFARGIEEAGISIKNHYHSEIDKNCINLYEKHFPNSKNLGDIRNINDRNAAELSENGGIDLITFGFPCQDLSVAGKRAGIDGERSGLFFEAIRLIKEIKPTYFIFENVKGLLTANRGEDFKRCLQEISNIGFYECEWQLVNTSWFLPQNRERVYFIGHARGKSRAKVFPIGESDYANTELQRQQTITTTERQEANTITARYGAGESNGTYLIESELKEKTKGNPQGNRINTTKGNSVCLSANGGGQGAKTGLYAIPVLTPNRETKRQNGRRFKTDGEPSFTLTTQDQHGVYNGISIRKLTPIECERLQGFPDNWTAGFSDNQRYKMLGNAVSVPLVKVIIQRVFELNDKPYKQ